MEHQKFKDEVRDAISLVAGQLFRGETPNTEDLEKAFNTIQQLEHKFSEALNCIDQIQAKIGHFKRE